MENLRVVSTIFWPCIVGNLSVLSFLFSNGKSNRCCNNFLGFQKIAIYPLLQFLSQMEDLTVVTKLTIVSILFSNGKSHCCFKRNRTGVLTNFWPFIVSSLYVVSILLSNGKSNRCYKNVLTLHCRQADHRFNSFLKWKLELFF